MHLQEAFVENNSIENYGKAEITNGCDDEDSPHGEPQTKTQYEQATIKTKTGSVTRLVPRNSKCFTGLKRRRPFGYYPDFTISKQTYAEIIAGGPPFTCPSCEKRFKRRVNHRVTRYLTQFVSLNSMDCQLEQSLLTIDFEFSKNNINT